VVPSTFENDPRLWVSELPLTREDGNKYGRGHALISGGYPVTGAARMAGRAAARAGAGLTTIAVPAIALPIYAVALTGTMVRPLAALDDFAGLLDDKRFSALLIGPGLIAEAVPTAGCVPTTQWEQRMHAMMLKAVGAALEWTQLADRHPGPVAPWTRPSAANLPSARSARRQCGLKWSRPQNFAWPF
jgi:hypothetical protein